VAKSLAGQGWTVLDRNWRGGRGEIDIVAVKDGRLRFVEVKARPTLGEGLDAVTPAKRRRLISAAQAWLVSHDTPKEEVCFGLALVLGGQAAEIEWIDNPFDGL